METTLIWIVGGLVLIVLWLWLVILPFRLLKGVLHRLGYHAHCGLACEVHLQQTVITLRLQNQRTKGVREGMRAALTFGPEESRKMLADVSLLPRFAATADDKSFLDRVRAKHSELSAMIDPADDLSVWTGALAIGLGECVARFPERAPIFTQMVELVRQYSGLEQDVEPQVVSPSQPTGS